MKSLKLLKTKNILFLLCLSSLPHALATSSGLKCSKIFEHSLAYNIIPNNTYDLLIKMYEQDQEFISFLRSKKGKSISEVVFQEHINKLDALAKKYLTQIGVKYEESEYEDSNVRAFGIRVKHIKYLIYKIKGVSPAATDPNALQLKELLERSEFQEENALTLRFDPLYYFLYSSAGSFNGGVISFTFSTFASRILGERDTIQHEAQHALEQVRLKNGKPTLAGFEFLDAVNNGVNGYYLEYLALDEAEAYLKDIRFLRSMQGKTVGSSEKMNINIAKKREAILRNYTLLLKEICISAKSILTEIVAALKNPDVKYQIKNEDFGRFSIKLSSLSNDHYSKVRIKLYSAENDSDALKRVRSLTDWSLLRIKQIEKEVNSQD